MQFLVALEIIVGSLSSHEYLLELVMCVFQRFQRCNQVPVEKDVAVRIAIKRRSFVDRLSVEKHRPQHRHISLAHPRTSVHGPAVHAGELGEVIFAMDVVKDWSDEGNKLSPYANRVPVGSDLVVIILECGKQRDERQRLSGCSDIV